MKSSIKFANDKLRISFKKLKDSKTEDKKLYEWINKALDDLEENAFCSTQVPKNLIPKIYINKYEIDNLGKYNLLKGWRLLYAVANNEITVLSIILEWTSHKDYERLFNY